MAIERYKIEPKVEVLAAEVLPGLTDFDPALGIIGLTDQQDVV